MDKEEIPHRLFHEWQLDQVPIHERWLFTAHDPSHPHVPFSKVHGWKD